MFAVAIDRLTNKIRQEPLWTMMFANDIVISSKSREQVEESLKRWRNAQHRREVKK